MSESAVSLGVGGGPDVERVVVDHAYRGLRLQVAMRAVLVVFIGLTLVVVPPVRYAVLCQAVFAGYVVWAVAVWVRRAGRAHLDASWLALFVDLAVVAAVTLVTGVAAEQSWTADVLVNALFMIPLLACTQLRPGVCAAGVVTAAVAVFLTASGATMGSNEEPWSSILLSTMALAGLGGGAVGLSWIQRSQVRTIAELVRDRNALLADLMTVEQRERHVLSERVHDGALQYVLAARQDLDEIREGRCEEVVDRIDRALREASVLLRSTASELHPAVLEHVGLVPALAELARAAAARGRFDIELDTGHWPDGLRTSADAMLFGGARELLANIVEHAAAHTVRVALRWTGQWATLEIADDGVGVPSPVRDRLPTASHTALAFHQVRLIAAGGTLTLHPGPRSGTVARLQVPAVRGSENDAW